MVGRITLPAPELHIRAGRETRCQGLADVMPGARRVTVQRVGFVSNPETK